MDGGLKQNYEYKALAREQLRGKWMIAVLVILIAWILGQAFQNGSGVRYTIVNGEFVRQTSSTFSKFGTIINLILAGPITYGVATFFLKLVRGQNPLLEDIFGGFKKFANTLLLHIISSIFIFLWTLLLIVPGIIASLKYSMAYYIMNDNPEITAMEAIRQSKEMMYGNKAKLFTLTLSFIGWFLLGILSLGIGLLWVGAYYDTAKANFYEDLKRNSKIGNYEENNY